MDVGTYTEEKNIQKIDPEGVTYYFHLDKWVSISERQKDDKEPPERGNTFIFTQISEKHNV